MAVQSTGSIQPVTVRSRDVRSLLEWGSALLSERGLDEARIHAEWLLAHALGVPRNRLPILFGRSLDQADVDVFVGLLSRRLTREPTQYIVGETEFMGLPITVDSRVLIPRPETELLAECAAECIARNRSGRVRVLDIGTGSGCIAVALARVSPACEIIGLDVSGDALEVARQNMIRHGITSVTLIRGDIFSDVLAGHQFECIVANPPYVPATEFDGLQPEVREFEPRTAVTDGADGLRFARRIAHVAAEKLIPGGTVLIEIGAGASDAVRDFFGSAGLNDIMMFEDYAHIPRVVSARRPTDGSTA